MIKLTFCLTRLPGMSRADFLAYWRDHHAPLVMEHRPALGFLKYIQSHVITDASRLPLAAVRGSAGYDYDGVAQFWWTNMAALAAGAATPEGVRAGERLLEDERRFIDLPRSPIFLSNEITIAQ